MAPCQARGRPAGRRARRARVERFARQLEGRYRVPVSLVDERFTSVEAEDRLKSAKTKSPLKKNIDSVAAQLILEQYFDELA